MTTDPTTTPLPMSQAGQASRVPGSEGHRRLHFLACLLTSRRAQNSSDREDAGAQPTARFPSTLTLRSPRGLISLRRSSPWKGFLDLTLRTEALCGGSCSAAPARYLVTRSAVLPSVPPTRRLKQPDTPTSLETRVPVRRDTSPEAPLLGSKCRRHRGPGLAVPVAWPCFLPSPQDASHKA